MEFTKQNLDGIRNDVNEALKAVGAKYGIELHIGNINFTSTTFSSKLNATVKEIGGVSVAKNTWNEDCKYFRLRPEDYGKVITVQGESYRIAGINFRAKAYPIKMVRVKDGKGFKFAAAMVRSALGIGN